MSYIPSKQASAHLTVRRSRFDARIMRADSVQQAEKFIDDIKRSNSSARHNVYAYIIDEKKKCSDDGEPSGTAGKPVLSLLEKEDMNNCVITVTRYFGGVLLGTGGLVRAYTDSAKQALDACEKQPYEKTTDIQCSCSYADFDRYSKKLANLGGIIHDTVFEENVSFSVTVTAEKAKKITGDMHDIVK